MTNGVQSDVARSDHPQADLDLASNCSTTFLFTFKQISRLLWQRVLTINELPVAILNCIWAHIPRSAHFDTMGSKADGLLYSIWSVRIFWNTTVAHTSD